MVLIEVGTPYLVVLLTAAIAFMGYIVRELNRLGRDVTELRTAFRFFVKRMGEGAAEILDTDNPTPRPMRRLLRKYVDGTLTESERLELTEFLRGLVHDASAQKSERNAAIQVLAAMQTLPRISKRNKWTSPLSFNS